MEQIPIRLLYLIDDDPLVNMINEKVVKLSNFASEIQNFTSAREALKKLKELALDAPDEIPEVIFLDINMPDMDGWEFLEEFGKFPESILGKTGVYVLSSSIDASEIKKAKEFSTVRDFHSKPITFSSLEKFVTV